MPAAVPSDLRDLAVETAVDAGELVHSMWHVRHDWEAKSSATDPVTEADRAGERRVLERLRAARPDDGFLGEEGIGNTEGTTGLRWCVDPLDGTVNFTYGLKQWCTSVGVMDAAGPLAGAIHAPALGETYVAVRNGGATCNGVQLTVTEVSDPAMTLVATGFHYDQGVRAVQGREVAQLVTQVRDVRRKGAAALDLAEVAAGRIDGYAEWGLNPWDWAVGWLLVTEAGGRATRFDRTIAGRAGQVVVAGGPAAHDWLVDFSTGLMA